MNSKSLKAIIACVCAAAALCCLPVQAAAETGNAAPVDTAALPQDSADLSRYPQEILDVINAERKKQGLAALQFDDVVMKAAQARSEELATSYSHTRPNGKAWSTALDELGLTTKPRAENIAYGSAPPQYVANVWLESPGHRKNIMDARYSLTGIAVYQTPDDELAWEQLFVE